MKKKCIIFITREIVPFYYGGIGTQFKAAAKFLKTKGHEVYFLTQRHKTFNEKIYHQHYGDIPLFFVDILDPSAYGSLSPAGGLVSTFSLAYAIAVSKEFDYIYDLVSPDIAICADFGGEGLFLFLKSDAGGYEKTRFILLIEGGLFDVLSTYESGMNSQTPSELNDPQNRITCAMENICILLASEIITPTSSYWKQLQIRMQTDKKPHVIPNFVDTDLFNPQNVDEATEKFRPLILFIGRLDRHKGADILLKAYLEMIKNWSGDKPELIFIGRDSFWKEHETTFLEYWKKRIPRSYSQNISFLGQVSHDQIVTYLKKATVCVFPSRWEVFGIVCLEAMYYGCPVLVSQGTGLEEVIGPSFSEYAFDVREEEVVLKKKLTTVLENPSELDKIRAGLRKRAEELINLSKSRFLKFIEKDVGKKVHNSKPKRMQAFENIFQLLSAINDVTYYLGIDYQELKDMNNEKKG
jgi:glycosyltransferase involved in cell wall biosynthesis